MNYEKIKIAEMFDVIKKTDENGVESIIPIDKSNADYIAYLDWVKEQKNIAKEAQIVIPPVEELSPVVEAI